MSPVHAAETGIGGFLISADKIVLGMERFYPRISQTPASSIHRDNLFEAPAIRRPGEMDIALSKAMGNFGNLLKSSILTIPWLIIGINIADTGSHGKGRFQDLLEPIAREPGDIFRALAGINLP